MPGSLTLGGMVAGTLAGSFDFGPSTVAGKRVIGRVEEIALEANVDFSVKVPSEAVQWAVFFASGSSAPEVKVGSNLVGTASGMPVAAQGHVSVPVAAGLTELKFKASTPPSAFQLLFI